MSGLDLAVVTAIYKLIAYWSTKAGMASFMKFLIIGGYGAIAYGKLIDHEGK